MGGKASETAREREREREGDTEEKEEVLKETFEEVVGAQKFFKTILRLNGTF